jgi:hypothetical protein
MAEPLISTAISSDATKRTDGLFRCNTRSAFLYSAHLRTVKKLAAILGLVLTLSGTAFARSGPATPFHVGEKLTYQIFWGPFVVGRATLEVAGIEKVDAHDCYHLVAKAKTSGLAEWLFPVDSTAESWLDCDGLFTRQYRENRSEGKHHANNETHFDYQRKEAVTTNRVKNREKRTSLERPVQDVVSSMYFVRAQKLMLDAEQSFTVNAANTNYVVTIRPDQRKEVWVRPLGNVQALRLEPSPTLKIVSSNKGRMWLWVSDDERRLPLLLNSELKLGNAKLVLFSIASSTPVSATTYKPADSVRSAPVTLNASPLASGR